MFAINRVKRMFSGSNQGPSDSLFESYYGSVLRENQEGGPSAEEARRDFEHIRRTVSRISVF